MTMTEKTHTDNGAGAINLIRLGKSEVSVPVRGLSPLIVHQFDQKARQMMLDKQQKKTKVAREIRDPQDEYERSRYRLSDDVDGFPATGFKSAIVNAASQFESMTKVLAKQSIFVFGEGAGQLVPIVGTPEMREDTVRLSGTTADLRYRAQYWPWEAELRIRFVQTSLTAEAVLALVDAAGLGGIGEWRPSAPRSGSGSYGMFEVVDQ